MWHLAELARRLIGKEDTVIVDEDKCEHCGSDPCTNSTEDCTG